MNDPIKMHASHSHQVIPATACWLPKVQQVGKDTGVGSHSLLQGNLPYSGIEPRSPRLQADSLPSEPPGKPKQCIPNAKFLVLTNVPWLHKTLASEKW